MKNTIVFIALLVVAFASCKKKAQSNCWTCVTRTVFQGNTTPLVTTFDSSQQCGLDSSAAYLYGAQHTQGWQQHDTMFYATTKCHL